MFISCTYDSRRALLCQTANHQKQKTRTFRHGTYTAVMHTYHHGAYIYTHIYIYKLEYIYVCIPTRHRLRPLDLILIPPPGDAQSELLRPRGADGYWGRLVGGEGGYPTGTTMFPRE